MPGRCPSCNQVYTDETLSFCPNDGTPLIKDAPSSYDPQATMIAQPPPTYTPQPQQPPPPQQGYYAPQGGQAPPQGGQAPPQGWQQPPYGQQQQFPPQYGAPPVGGKSSKLPLIIALAAIVLIGGGIGLYFLLRDNSSSTSSRSNNNNSATTSNTSTRTTNTSTTSTFPTPSTSTTNTTTTTTATSDYSDDEKHKLFQAVGITKDTALIIEVAEKIGLSDASGNPTPAMQPFIQEHMSWAMNNRAWVQEHLDPAKAREYVMAHK